MDSEERNDYRRTLSVKVESWSRDRLQDRMFSLEAKLKRKNKFPSCEARSRAEIALRVIEAELGTRCLCGTKNEPGRTGKCPRCEQAWKDNLAALIAADGPPTRSPWMSCPRCRRPAFDGSLCLACGESPG
jgi:hypothetical protein